VEGFKIKCDKCGADVPGPNAKFCTQCGNRMAMLIVEDAPIPPRLAKALGSDYSVVGELGRGGFAVVYSVRDRKHNRYLAVKVMHPQLMASSEVVERFRREAEIAGKLDHPNILSVAFSGEGEGLVYYAMPRVKGLSLRERLKRDSTLAVDAATDLFCQIARGLAHAHTKQVVHRDIKPANVMIQQDGVALILDFGIAKGLAAGVSSLTMTGQRIGSAEYMSPEQAAGDKTLDGRSDIYSLGLTAFEMLTGKTPFAGGSTLEIVARRFMDGAPDVRTLRKDVNHGFADSIARCLATDPKDRWQQVEDAIGF
jgi:serine/threonine protein kinase